MPTILEGTLDATGHRYAIAVSRWNDFITRRLLDGALECIRMHGGSDEQVTIAFCPGAFELPLVARRLAETGSCDAVIALGAVIRGATPHFDLVAAAASNGIASVAIDTGVPVANGVLTVESIEQAIERSGTKSGNKGWEAAQAAIEMINVLRAIGSKS